MIAFIRVVKALKLPLIGRVRVARFVRHAPLAALGIFEAGEFYMAHTGVFINAEIARVSAHFHHALFRFI